MELVGGGVLLAEEQQVPRARQPREHFSVRVGDRAELRRERAEIGLARRNDGLPWLGASSLRAGPLRANRARDAGQGREAYGLAVHGRGSGLGRAAVLGGLAPAEHRFVHGPEPLLGEERVPARLARVRLGDADVLHLRFHPAAETLERARTVIARRGAIAGVVHERRQQRFDVNVGADTGREDRRVERDRREEVPLRDERLERLVRLLGEPGACRHFHDRAQPNRREVIPGEASLDASDRLSRGLLLSRRRGATEVVRLLLRGLAKLLVRRRNAARHRGVRLGIGPTAFDPCDAGGAERHTSSEVGRQPLGEQRVDFGLSHVHRPATDEPLRALDALDEVDFANVHAASTDGVEARSRFGSHR